MVTKKNAVDKAAVARSRELQRHESTIEAAQKSFVELGRALGKIRAEQLYLVAGCDSFEEYVEERWDIGRAHAYRLINAARVALSLSPMGYKIDSERVARELAAAPDDEARARLAEEATRRADGRRLTAALVAATREEMFPDATVIDGDLVDEPPAIEAPAEPAPADIPDALREAIAETAASIGAGIPAPAAPALDVLCAGDPLHCGKCGADLPKGEQDGGHLRCRACDSPSLHKSLHGEDGDFNGVCERCTSIAARATQTATGTVDATPVDAGGPQRSTSGPAAPTGSSSPEPVGVTPQERIEGEAVERRDRIPLPVYCHDCKSIDERCEQHLDSPAEPRQPGQDSPTGRDPEPEPEIAVATAGRSETDHHRAGVSGGEVRGDSGQSPAGQDELEDGVPPAVAPSSSDPEVWESPAEALVSLFQGFVNELEGIDHAVIGPELTGIDLYALQQARDRLVEHVALFEKYATP